MPSRYDVKVTCGVCAEVFLTVADSIGHEHFTDVKHTPERETRLSDCAYGCKYCGCSCGQEQLHHSAVYGCPIGRAQSRPAVSDTTKDGI